MSLNLKKGVGDNWDKIVTMKDQSLHWGKDCKIKYSRIYLGVHCRAAESDLDRYVFFYALEREILHELSHYRKSNMGGTDEVC